MNGADSEPRRLLDRISGNYRKQIRIGLPVVSLVTGVCDLSLRPQPTRLVIHRPAGGLPRRTGLPVVSDVRRHPTAAGDGRPRRLRVVRLVDR